MIANPVEPHGSHEPLSDNERMIMEIVRRSRGISRAAITEHTNLTQQSVHRIVEGLLEQGLLELASPVVQGRGKPSPRVVLNPRARYSIGISVNTDTTSFCVTDLACSTVHHEVLERPPTERLATLAEIRLRLDELHARNGIAPENIAGVGFGMAGFFVGGDRVFNPPEPLADWAFVDFAEELRSVFGTQVWTENNATTGAIGECVLGAGLDYPTFGYFSFNYGFGGGVVIDGKPFPGSFGNAGEISRVFTPDEGPSRPALGELIKHLNRHGIRVETVRELRREFDPAWPGVAEWVERTGPYLNRAIDAMRAVIDPAAIVYGGELPRELGNLLLAWPPTEEIPRGGRSARYPDVFLSTIEGDPAVLGAALIPLKNRYFV